MNREDWIGAYLSGALRGEKLKGFEDQMKNDPTLRSDVEAVKSFTKTIDETQDFPEVLEMIKEADNASSPKQMLNYKLFSVLTVTIAVVLIALLLWFLFNQMNKDNPSTNGPINTQEVIAANFKDFIEKKYYDNTQFIDGNVSRGGSIASIDSLLMIVFQEANVFARQGDWIEVDRILSVDFTNDTMTNYEKDAVSFIGGLARLQIDSCDAIGKERLLAIPKREFHNFYPVSQEILDRVESIDCSN